MPGGRQNSIVKVSESSLRAVGVPVHIQIVQLTHRNEKSGVLVFCLREQIT